MTHAHFPHRGYFRKGSALVSLKQHAKARQAFEEGLALAPGDKSFIAQLDKLRNAPSSTSPSTTVATAPGKTKSLIKGTSTSGGGGTSKATASAAVEDDDHYDGESSSFRGYKKTADGRVTTFFHNELDEHTKALIGDIAPKKLDPSESAVSSSAATVVPEGIDARSYAYVSISLHTCLHILLSDRIW